VRPKREQQQEAHPEHDPLAYFLEQAKAFLIKNGLHILLAVGLVLVGALTYKIVAARRSTHAQLQWQAVSNFPEIAVYLYGPEKVGTTRDISIEQCRAIIDSGKTTQATPWVMLRLADLYASADQWPAAVDAYKRLIARYPGSEAASWAKPALAAALEQLGQYAEAAPAYEQLAEAGPARFFLDAGRCRELAGDLRAAEADYRKLLERKATNELNDEANTRLAALAEGRPLQAPPEIKLPKPAPAVPAVETMQVPTETPVAPAEKELAPEQPPQKEKAD
jgi:tetratricopeptide (TPR) repeat protein